MKLIPRFKSLSLITFCFNIASPTPQHFYEVDKYIENFQFVTDDISVPNDTKTEKAFIGDYFESPRRNVQKNNDEELDAIKQEYLKELEEQKTSERNRINQITEETDEAFKILRKSEEIHATHRDFSRVCGADKTDTLDVVEGSANIESFPWLGVLIYPKGKTRLITTVILVTRHTVIGSALDIERLPKLDFRKNSKVILGQTCKHPGIKVVDYNYHPDYGKETYSSVVLIQIDLASVAQALWPICGPPKVLKVAKFYTITLPSDCRKSKVQIFAMDYVKPEICKHYYRRTGLDLSSIWPKHGACGRARTEEECVWRNGAALAVKQSGRWHLMGIGVNGPGCAAPSRYVDYAVYSGWVADSVARIGRPALTRLADNHLILRRTINKIPRYGPCDANELQFELFCDRTNTTAGERERGRVRYNLTLIENYDYTCIALKANSRYKRPKISLKGVCDSPHPICYSANRFVLDFYVEIAFSREVWFKICVYGKLVAMPDPKGALKYFNRKKPPVPIPWGFPPTDELFVEEPDETPGPKLGLEEKTTTDSYTGDESETTPESTDEFWSTTPIVDKNDSSTPPESTDEFWSTTPIVDKNDSSTPPESTDEFWTITPIVDKNDSSTPPESTDEFWSITPIVDKDDSSSATPPESTDEFWSITPIVPKDDSSSATPAESTDEFWSITPIVPDSFGTIPEPTDDFWSITPIVSKDNESSYPTPPEPTGDFWSITPVVSKDNESSYPTPPEPTGDFWSITPVVSKDNESSYPTPPEPTGEFWSVTPVVSKDNESSYPTPPEPTGDFWSITPIESKDNKSSHPTPPEPTGEFWSVTPVGSKDNEWSYPTPPEPTGEFWSLTPVVQKGIGSSHPTPPEPTGEYWSVTPIVQKGNESSHPTPPEPTGEFWSVTPIVSKHNESSYPTPPDPTGEFWSLTPVRPVDDDSFTVTPREKQPAEPKDEDLFFSTPDDNTGEFWSLTPILPKYNKYSSVTAVPARPNDDKTSVTPVEPTGEFWSLTPVKNSDDELLSVIPVETSASVKPKDDDLLTLIPIEPTDEFWSLTPILQKDDESSSVIPVVPTAPDDSLSVITVEPTGEFWSLGPSKPGDEESSYGASIDPTGEFWSVTPILSKDDESLSVIPVEPTAPGHPLSVIPMQPTSDSWSLSTSETKDKELPIDPTDEFWSLQPINNNEFSSMPSINPKNKDESSFVIPVEPIAPDDSLSVIPMQHTSNSLSLTPSEPTDKGPPMNPTDEFWSLPPILLNDNEFSSTTPVKHKDETSSSPVEPSGEFGSLKPAEHKDEDNPIGEFWTLTPIVQNNKIKASVISVEPTVPVADNPQDDVSLSVMRIKPASELWRLTPVMPKDVETSATTAKYTKSVTQTEPTSTYWSLTPVMHKGDEPFSAASVEIEQYFLSSVLPNGNKSASIIPKKPTTESWSLTPIMHKYDKTSTKPVQPKHHELLSHLQQKPTSGSWRPTLVTHKDTKIVAKPVKYAVSAKTKDHELLSYKPPKSTGQSLIPVMPTKPAQYFLSSVLPKGNKSASIIPKEPTTESWSLTPIMHKYDKTSTKTVQPKHHELLSHLPQKPTSGSWRPTLVTHKDTKIVAKPVEYAVPAETKDHEWSYRPLKPTGQSLIPVMPTNPAHPKNNEFTLPIPSKPTQEWSLTPVMPKFEKPSPVITTESPEDSVEFIMADEEYPIWPVISIASSDMLTVTEQTTPTTDKPDVTSFAEDPLQPWWAETPISSTDSLTITNKDEPTPDKPGGKDYEYGSYQPWWTEDAYTETTGAEDVFTDQETLGPTTATKVTLNDKSNKLNSLWLITPVNKIFGGLMPPDGEVLMVTPENTPQEENVYPINEPDDTGDFDMLWAVSPFATKTDELKGDTSMHLPEVDKPYEFLEVISENLEDRWTTEEPVSLSSLSDRLTSMKKKIKTVRPEFVNSLLSTRIILNDKIEETSKTVNPQSIKNPVPKEKGPKKVNKLETIEKMFEEIINITPVTFPAELQNSIPHAEKKLHVKTDMKSAKTINFLKEKTNHIKDKINPKEILAVTPITMPVELKIVPAKIVSSEEEDIQGEIMRISKSKPRFNGERFVKPQILSSNTYRQPIYLRNLVTRRLVTQKSGLNMRQTLIKWNRAKRPGGFI